MIDGRYTDEEWQSIVEASGSDAWIDAAREPLEQSIQQYCNVQSVVFSMKDSVRFRDQWAELRNEAEALLQSVRGVECWDPPSWGGTSDEKSPGRERAIEAIQAIIHQAEFCKDEYHTYARGQKKPERNELYSGVLEVWADYLGRPLRYSKGGPVERFFRAALLPVLGDETPKGARVRDIIDAKKLAQAGRSQNRAEPASSR